MPASDSCWQDGLMTGKCLVQGLSQGRGCAQCELVLFPWSDYLVRLHHCPPPPSPWAQHAGWHGSVQCVSGWRIKGRRYRDRPSTGEAV